MRLASALLLVLSASATASPKLPAHYAKLFEARTWWKYSIARTDTNTTEPDATCKVQRVITIGKIVASEILCDHELPMAGVYLAMPDGLYRSGLEFPTKKDEIGDLAVHQLLIQARPRASAKSVTRYAPTTPITKSVTTSGARREDKMWCWYRTTDRGTSSRTDTLCFDGGIDHGVEAVDVFHVRESGRDRS